MTSSAMKLLVISTLLGVGACAAPASPEPTEALESASTRARPPALPAPGGRGALAPWGGDDATRWRPEAVLANAVSRALNDAWRVDGVRDVVVATPLRMWPSDHFPFGDGQSNAAPSFEGYPGGGRPPVVAARLDLGDRVDVLLRLDRALGVTGRVELRFFDGAQARSLVVQGDRDADGDLVARFTAPVAMGFGALGSDAAIALRPEGWNDWFPLSFEHHAVDARTIPSAAHLDAAGVASSLSGAPGAAFASLSSRSFAEEYNGARGVVAPYATADVHARFPFYRTMIVTGVGEGFTWLRDARPSGFKTMYQCFSARRAVDEARAPDGGVASGGGWHRIGDAAETLVNDLERVPFVVAQAKGNPFVATGLPHGGFAWGLSDVATFRFLHPGEAFVTRRGGTYVDPAGRAFDQSRYHWFFFHRDAPVCAELVVDPG